MNFYDCIKCEFKIKLVNFLIFLINIIGFYWWYIEMSISFEYLENVDLYLDVVIFRNCLVLENRVYSN